jgi:hypothetical protein
MMNLGLSFYSFLILQVVSRTPWVNLMEGVEIIFKGIMMHNTIQHNSIIIFHFPTTGLLDVGASTSYNPQLHGSPRPATEIKFRPFGLKTGMKAYKQSFFEHSRNVVL